MAAEAEAAREARAKVIAAEGEMKASRALKEASDVIMESPAALQVELIRKPTIKFVGTSAVHSARPLLFLIALLLFFFS